MARLTPGNATVRQKPDTTYDEARCEGHMFASSAFAPGRFGETSFACTRARRMVGAGNGIRTRDFDLGKVALYH